MGKFMQFVARLGARARFAQSKQEQASNKQLASKLLSLVGACLLAFRKCYSHSVSTTVHVHVQVHVHTTHRSQSGSQVHYVSEAEGTNYM